MVFYLSSSLAPAGAEDLVSDLAPEESQALAEESSLAQVEDPDSPLHGLSLEEIQDVSVMPVSGWLDPQMNERFLRVVDEGIFQRPDCLPGGYGTSLWMRHCGVILHPIPAFFPPLPAKKSS